MGGNVSHTIKSRFGSFDTQNTVGVQVRRDDISVGLLKTVQRMTLSTLRSDSVAESSIGLYTQNTTRWTNWMRTVAGLRGDYFTARVDSDNPANSGNADVMMASPKIKLILGPFHKTELFLSVGTGFHSNDVRGATITLDPRDGVTPLQKVPLLVHSKGAEAGVRFRAIDGLDSSLALFVLDYASEILFVGDAGTTGPSRPRRRIGIEWTNHYKSIPGSPTTWTSP